MVNYKIPEHIAFIMDGNGRWAASKGLARSKGHLEGIKTMKNVISICTAIGIEYVSFFAFSTENWSRPAEEINNLFDYIRKFLKREAQDYLKQNFAVRFIGDMDGLPSDIAATCAEFNEKARVSSVATICIYLNYGGKSDIVNACNRLLKKGRERVIETEFEAELYTHDIPEPDLLIRTGGEMRLSNFMLYQLAYSELIFTDCYWPDFNKERLEEMLAEYALRTRKFGG
ncbi:MAG: di-trans,poly-cis-decaprenylcistransferase [Clostridia bacterium]|nr:di-trans,poly-cis-decaprenylcistransferase [Clostridia bacterium]